MLLAAKIQSAATLQISPKFGILDSVSNIILHPFFEKSICLLQFCGMISGEEAMENYPFETNAKIEIDLKV
ncbi:MAG: hypothetical protein P4N59_02665 [Negativicutes bacterium]|nr:hypothetical protein [Negativicutes bacterium]